MIIIYVLIYKIKNLKYIIMFHSQDNQDNYLETNIFKVYKHGFYVDVGAHDGISINNIHSILRKIMAGVELILNLLKRCLINW